MSFLLLLLLLLVSGTQDLVPLLHWLSQKFPNSCGGLTAGKQWLMSLLQLTGTSTSVSWLEQ